MKPERIRKSRKRGTKAVDAPATARYALGRNLTIYEANTAKEELLNSLALGTTIELDLSQVAEMDTAGVQLLMLAHRECMNQGKCLRVTERSQAVQQLLDLYDLAQLFGNAPPAAAATEL